MAHKKNIYDVPNERKIHTTQITSLGGLAIFAGFILAVLLLSLLYSGTLEFQYFIAGAFIIFFVGLIDDLIPISPLKKFLGQALVAALIIYKEGLLINSMHGFLGVNELPQTAKIMLTFFTIILIINAFNLIDGIDGLAGTLGLMVALLLGSFFLKVQLIPYAILSFSLAGSLIAFLIFNYQPARIFMGDSGSLLMGLVIAILIIKFINIAPSNNALPLVSSPAIAFSLLLIPLLDTLRLFGLRIFSRRSPFMADKNHIQHILLKRGFSHKKIIFVLINLSLFFIVFSLLGNGLGITWLILVMTGLFFSFIGLLYTIPRKNPEHIKSERKKKTIVKSIFINETISFHKKAAEPQKS
jgi:UDP-N-acetylmuramyl pentapeptide phosphotransferase/UDP-N-acetylglucosamine-1-phosphate transferase